MHSCFVCLPLLVLRLNRKQLLCHERHRPQIPGLPFQGLPRKTPNNLVSACAGKRRSLLAWRLR